MPIYEYKCQKCGKELEVMHKVDAPAPAECPECHQTGSLQRLVSRTSFHLKGGGWYSDLYGSTKSDSSSSTPASSTSASSATTPSSSTTTTTTTSTPAAPAAPSSPSSGSTGSGGTST